MLRLGVSNFGWTQPSGVAPELSLVFSSSGADHRGQEVLSTGAWKSPRAAWGEGIEDWILPARGGTGPGVTAGQQQQGTSGPGSSLQSPQPYIAPTYAAT